MKKLKETNGKPHPILIEQLSLEEKRLLEILYELNKGAPTGVLRVSYKIIKKYLNWSKKKVYKILKSLIKRGILKRVRKSYYEITLRGRLILETIYGMDTIFKSSFSNLLQTAPLAPLITGLIGFEAFNRLINETILHIRPHNIHIYIPLKTTSFTLTSNDKIETPFGTVIPIIPKDFDRNPYVIFKLKDGVLLRSYNVADAIEYIYSLPYKLAFWLEEEYGVVVDYRNIRILHAALSIVFNPNNISNETIERLKNWFFTFGTKSKKTTFLLDESIRFPELEVETDDVGKIINILIVLVPFIIIEFLKKNMEICFETLKTVKEMMRILKDIADKNINGTKFY